MFRMTILLPFLVAALTVSACGQATKDVTPTEAKAMIDKGSVVVVDVRTDGEWNAGHLKDALHIDISSSDFEKKIKAIEKNKTVVVYCAVGGRSSRAASSMTKMGFKKVYNMDGGYNGWSALKYPVTK